MKICVISTGVFKIPVAGYAGLEHLAWQIAAGLAARGHAVSVVAPDGSSCPNCELIPIGPEGHGNEKESYKKYWKRLPEFDCIIDHSWNKWAYILKAEGKLKAPILGVTHAPINTMYATLPPVDRPCFVCISQDQADHFKALHGRQARVAYNGVDSAFYRPLGVKRSDRFLFLARFSTIKGPDIAVEVCKRAGVGLDLVGDYSITQEPDYLAKVQAACDGRQIRMVGPQTRGSCVWWLSQAYALLHPNLRFREPFGLAPVEAMCCECPVIAWDYGAMRETVNHGYSGWLVNSMEEMVAAVKNLESLAAVKEEHRPLCRRQGMTFSVDRMISRYEELCNEAVNTGGW